MILFGAIVGGVRCTLRRMFSQLEGIQYLWKFHINSPTVHTEDRLMRAEVRLSHSLESPL